MAKQEIVPSIEASIQSRVKDDVEFGSGLLMWLSSANDLVPPWWSKRRDIELRSFWKSVDYLSGAIYTLESRMTTIPFRVVAKDNSIEAHVKQSEKFQEILRDGSEFGKGWGTFFGKWIEDLLTQDNGAFAEIIGPGEPDGPLMGVPLSMANLDSGRCVRTSDPEFPVIYQDKEGKYKLHHTRVALASLMPSPMEEMHDVGFCGVSRCINTAQHLLDILVYKQEKLGSRPQRGIMVAKGGLDPENISAAFKLANETMDNEILSRYSKFVLVGSSSAVDAGIDVIDLSSLPDGFDEQTSVTLGMATIALAFGVDARELFPAQGVGATKADALVQHLKSRGKGIGQLLDISEREFSNKFLPPYMELEFDFQDDAQDKQVAEIKKIRSDRHTVDLTNESVDERIVREQMFADGDLTQAQFEDIELRSGRLPDGATALSLFHSPEHGAMLELGVPDPLNIEANDAEIMRGIISDKRTEFIEALGKITIHRNRKLLKEAMTALDVLEAWYEEAASKEAMAEMQATMLEGGDEETPNEDNEEVDDSESDQEEKDLAIQTLKDATAALTQMPDAESVMLKTINAVKNLVKPAQVFTYLDVPEQKPADVKVDVDVKPAEVKVYEKQTVNVPKVPVEMSVAVGVQSPDEVVETETMIERDDKNRIVETKKTSKRKGK